MDTELLLVLSSMMLVLICFINIMYLRYSFTKLVANSENLQAIRIHKRKWSFILFTDLIVYIVILGLLLIANVSSKATLISLFITIIYIESINRKMRRSGAEISASSEMKNKEFKNDNGIININTDQQLIDSVGMRRLIIKRIRDLFASLLKVYIYIETEENTDDYFKITMDGYQFKQIGSIANGKTLTLDVPKSSLKMLVCTNLLFTFRRIPINMKRFDISAGNEDVFLNIQAVPNNPARVPPGVSYIIEQETK